MSWSREVTLSRDEFDPIGPFGWGKSLAFKWNKNPIRSFRQGSYMILFTFQQIIWMICHFEKG